MKLQMLEISIYDRSNTTLHPVIEVADFREAILKTHFEVGYDVQDYEIDEIEAAFVEKDNMFIADGDEISVIYFKV